MKKNYKEIMPQITTFIFDVDGVLTDGTVIVDTKGELYRKMNTKDGYALKSAVDEGFKVCVITGGHNEGVRIRLEGLGITDIYLGCHDKINKYNELLEKYDLNPQNILYMGDDIPDLQAMQQVGLACCPKDAVNKIQKIADYISQKRGGKGCVRDVVEQVLKVQGKWAKNFDASYD